MLRVTERFCYQLLSVHTHVNVQQKLIDVFQNDVLVFFVVLHELDQKDVSFLNNLQISVFVFLRFKCTLLYDLNRDFVRFEVPQ